MRIRARDARAQRFEELRANGCLYVDKTAFVRDWWLEGGFVTLVCRPPGFGKTLNLDTVRCFLSTEYAGRGEELFGGLDMWEGGTKEQRDVLRTLQGTVPVVFLSFADVKATSYTGMLAGVKQVLHATVEEHAYLASSAAITRWDRAFLARVSGSMDDVTATSCLERLCSALKAHWGVAPVVLLDAYDAPMEAAWTEGWWDRAQDFMGPLMLSTFKVNEALRRALITATIYVPCESALGDLNNWAIATASTARHRTSFASRNRRWPPHSQVVASRASATTSGAGSAATPSAA